MIALTIDKRITCFLVLRLCLKQLVVMDLLFLSSYFKKLVLEGECAPLFLSLEYLKLALVLSFGPSILHLIAENSEVQLPSFSQ